MLVYLGVFSFWSQLGKKLALDINFYMIFILSTNVKMPKNVGILTFIKQEIMHLRIFTERKKSSKIFILIFFSVKKRKKPGILIIKLSCCMKFVLLINVKMPTIVGILTFCDQEQ